MTLWKCQCTNPDCNLSVELSDETILELTNPKWIVLVHGCLGSPPDEYKLIRRNTAYNIYSSDIKSDIEEAVETADIVNDPAIMEALKQSERAVEEGRVIPWEQIKKELDLE